MTASVSDRRATPRAVVQHKRIAFEVKAVDEQARTFKGLAASWSLDSGGDVIRKGAFKRTLDGWRAQKKQRPIPLIDQHNYGSVSHVIGMMTEAEETDEGLISTFAMVPDDPAADAAFRRIKGGFVTGLSIGYEPVVVEAPNDEDRRKGVWRYLNEVKLREVSSVIWGMNEDALVDTATAKALLAKGKKALSDAERATLEVIRTDIDALLSPDPADDETIVEGDSAKGLASPEQVAAIKSRILLLNLRRLATRSLLSGPARVDS